MKKVIFVVTVLFSLQGMMKTDAQVVISTQIVIAPPALQVYAQPMCPNEGYLWTPGYWAYGTNGYFWVPGMWISPPQVGFLWTPGYWGYDNSNYLWHGGYWGANIGFYGGINYGYGYGGSGFYGGRWDGGTFRYNTAVCHVGSSFHNTYVDKTVIVNNNNHTSFNGKGGITAQPNAAEQSAMKETHIQPTSAQQTHESSARTAENQSTKTNSSHKVATKTSQGKKQGSSGTATKAVGSQTAHNVSANHTSHTNTSHQQTLKQPVKAHQQQHAPQQHVQHSAPIQQHQGGAPSHEEGGVRK
jgi:hypothetical protein